MAHNDMRGMIADGQLMAEFALAEPARIVAATNIEAEDIEESEAQDIARIECKIGDRTLGRIVHHLGLALGGRPGAVLAARLMLPVSNVLEARALREEANAA